jgi:hypothetical protein
MNNLEIVFLKNYDLKIQKTVFANHRQNGAFFKTRNFKNQIEILPNA